MGQKSSNLWANKGDLWERIVLIFKRMERIKDRFINLNERLGDIKNLRARAGRIK